jgi:hypothetical protein
MPSLNFATEIIPVTNYPVLVDNVHDVMKTGILKL